MNGKKAKKLRQQATKMYEELDPKRRKLTSEKRMYKWLKKVYEKGVK